MNKSYYIAFCSVLLVALFMVSCKPKDNYPGTIFMPDMTYSVAYDAYASTKYVMQSEEDSMSAILPINGTIPRGYLPDDEHICTDEALLMSYVLKNYIKNPIEYPSVDEEQRLWARENLKNPLMLSDENLADGKDIYMIYCAVCHGKTGMGDGSIVVLPDGNDGPFSAIPPSYEVRLPTLTDGEMFYSISYGKNQMGGYYSQVSVEDRWKLVHYIKDMAGMNEETALMEEI